MSIMTRSRKAITASLRVWLAVVKTVRVSNSIRVFSNAWLRRRARFCSMLVEMSQSLSEFMAAGLSCLSLIRTTYRSGHRCSCPRAWLPEEGYLSG